MKALYYQSEWMGCTKQLIAISDRASKLRSFTKRYVEKSHYGNDILKWNRKGNQATLRTPIKKILFGTFVIESVKIV